MDAGRELLEVTLSALHPVVSASSKPDIYNGGRHHPRFGSPALDSASAASDVVSSVNSTSGSETSFQAPNSMHRADVLVTMDDSLSGTADAIDAGRRHFQHNSSVQNMLQLNKTDTSTDMNSSRGSVRVRVPSRLLKEISCPFTHEHNNTPSPPPALRGRYSSPADQPSLHHKDKRAKSGARLEASLTQGASVKEESPTDDSVVTVKSLSEDHSRQSNARKTLSQLAARNASEGKVIYPVVVEGGKESVQEKADGKGNLQELAAIVASSATAAAIAASQRHIAKEIEGNRHAASQTKSEDAFLNMATESTQTHVSRQEGAPRKEAALTESSLLSELSVLRQEILREVRQDRDDISKKLHEIQEDQCLHKHKQPPFSIPMAPQVLRENKSVQAGVTERGSEADERHVARAPRLAQDCKAQAHAYRPSMDAAEVQKMMQSMLAGQGSCLSLEELLSASRLDERLNEVHQKKKRLDLNMMWMERDSEHAALLRLLENPALADVHAKLNKMQSQGSDDKENDTMAVKSTLSVSAEKHLKSKVTRSKVSPSKLVRARLPIEHPKGSRRVATRPRAITPRHTTMFSTPVVHGKRGWGAPAMTSCHTHNLQPSHPSTATSRSRAQFLGCESGTAVSPVHVALPLSRPRIMPSSAIHPGPPPKPASNEMPRSPAPPPKPPPTAPLYRLQPQTLSPVDINTDTNVESCTASQDNLNMQALTCPQGDNVDVREYSEFHNFVEIKSTDQSSSEGSLVSANEYVSISGQQVWVTPTWTPQKQQHASSVHQQEGGGGGEVQIVKEISQVMSTNLVQRVQDELLARLWARQQEKHAGDPIETGSQASCSTCGSLSGKRKEGTQVSAHLLGGDGVPFLVGQQQPVDSCLVRQLVADALLDAARSHFYIAQTEETHAEVKASSGDQEYSADFESTTTTSVVSVPSAPSTPRDTPPLGRGMRGDTPPLDGGVRAEVEVPEEEGVADDPAAVTPVMTPRPTSEEEETTLSGSSSVRVSPAGTPLLTEEEEEEEEEEAEAVDASREAATPHCAIEAPKLVTTPVEPPHLLVVEEPPFPSPTGSTITAPSPQRGRVTTEDRHEVTLSESASSASTKPEPSVSASSSSTDHEVSLGEYLLGPLGRARRANITLSEGEVPISPGDTEWCAQYARKLGKLTLPGERRRQEWSATLSSSTSDDTTLKEAAQSEGEVRRRRTVKKPFQNIPSYFAISTPTDSSTPGQDASSSSTDDSRLSQRSDPFPTPSFMRVGTGLLRTHKVPPAIKHMRPPVSQDVSVGEVAPRVSSSHRSIGELPSRLRVLLEPPDKQAQDTSAMSPGEIAISANMRQRRTVDGVDVITVGSAHRRHHLQSAPDSSVSVGEVVSYQDDTLASLESTVQLVHSGEDGMTNRAEGEQLSTGRSPKSGTGKGETVKIQSEEEIQTEYQTDTFTSMVLTQESSDFPMKQLTDGPQTEFACALQVGEGLVKDAGVVKGRAVLEEAEVKEKHKVEEGGEAKEESVTEDGEVQEGDSSQVPSAYQDDTFQLSTATSLESTEEQSTSDGNEASPLEVEQERVNAVPSSTDDFILTVSGSDTATLSF